MSEGFGAQRRAATAGNAVILIALATAVVVVLNLIVSQQYVRWDWTSDAVMKLSDRTHNFIRELEKPLNIYVFYAPPGAYGAQTNRADEVYQVHHLAREYELASDLITLQTLDPDGDRSRAEELRQQFGISVPEMGNGVVVFEYQGRVSYATDGHLFQTDVATLKALREAGRPVAGAPRLFQGEDVFTSAIVTLKDGGLPSVAILKGQGMVSPSTYDEKDMRSAAGSALRLREALRRATFEVDELPLEGHSRINKAYDCIIVGGPTEPLPPTTIAALRRYVADGGNLVVLVHAALDIRPDGQVPFYKHGLDDFLAEWGVTLKEEVVLQHARVPTGIRPFSGNFSPIFDRNHPLTRSMGGDPPHRVEFAQVRPVDYDDGGKNHSTGQVIAHTDGTGVRVVDLVGLRTVSKEGPHARMQFLSKFEAGEQPVGVAITSVKPAGDGDSTRLVVLGSRSFATDAQQGYYDTDLMVNAVNWCAKREQLIGIGPKDARKVRFDMEPAELTTVYFFSVFGLPFAIGLLGVVVWYVRRREGPSAAPPAGDAGTEGAAA
ncbi:MAG: GldG family protein [Planctomycetota bacterium]|jgi:ABC-type uncharacterized transport system involved in gliding motility auxiliary subunit